MVPNQANTTLTIIVEDSDDLPPRFTEGIYRTKINEIYPITVSLMATCHIQYLYQNPNPFILSIGC